MPMPLSNLTVIITQLVGLCMIPPDAKDSYNLKKKSTFETKAKEITDRTQ